MANQFFALEDNDICGKTIIDVRKKSENCDSETFEAFIVQTKKVKLEGDGNINPIASLSGALPSDSFQLTALSGGDQDIYCDVTFFTTMIYDRKASPDPFIDYCYRITSIKGGVISKSDSQISVTKLTLGFVEHGEYWINGTGGSYMGTLKNMAKYSKTYPVIGTTYTTSGPSQAYYYCIEDYFSGIQTRTTIYVKRLNSSFTGKGYVDFVKGTAFGDW